MKIGLIVIGKTDAGYFVEAINEYKNRLTHYIPFEMEVIPDIKNVKNLSEAQQKEKEGELILKALQPGDYLVLLDEKGKEFTSMPLRKRDIPGKKRRQWPWSMFLIWKRKCIRSRNAWYLWWAVLTVLVRPCIRRHRKRSR